MHHQETDLTLYLELGRPKLAKANDDEFSKAAIQTRSGWE